MAIMKCSDLSFAYDGKTVLEGVNFELEKGDYLCIVGENGSGKSTLMKGLLGLKAPSGGSISLGAGCGRQRSAISLSRVRLSAISPQVFMRLSSPAVSILSAAACATEKRSANVLI